MRWDSRIGAGVGRVVLCGAGPADRCTGLRALRSVLVLVLVVVVVVMLCWVLAVELWRNFERGEGESNSARFSRCLPGEWGDIRVRHAIP